MSVQLPADWWILLIASLLVAGVLAAAFATRVRLPGLLLFLALGMLVADDGLGLVSLADPRIAQIGGTVALLLILYEGGLTTKPGDLKQAALPGSLLATVGVLITAAVVGGGTYLLLDVEPLTAFLIGAVVASTDAAAVFAMLRRAPLPRKMASLLEVESGANDPIAIMLTIGLLETWRANPGAGDWVTFALVQLLGGAIIGAALGVAASWLLMRVNLGPAGVYPVAALGIAGLAYGTAAAVGASGFLAVYVTGLFVGARVPLHRRGIRTFHQGLSSTAEVGLFLMLGMLVFPTQLPSVIGPGLVVSAILVLLARPIAVLLCLIWLRYRWQELAFTSWVGLRGAVPIVLATFPLAAGYPEGQFIFNMVFFVVLVSAAVQGSTISAVAGWLGLRDKRPHGVAVAEEIPISDINTELIEVHVTEDLPIVGRQLVEIPPPHGLITTIVRRRRTLIPTPRTRVRSGDLIIVATARRPHASRTITAWARGETATTKDQLGRDRQPDGSAADGGVSGTAERPPPTGRPDGPRPGRRRRWRSWWTRRFSGRETRRSRG
ncbi:potassium/proton antiporter [Natronosporangium hydrolyticum]|uniref:Potassium/proton antiporter n=1 Tax=Natronosporangium hydrolyticum TaxID=2811111 RepID=A0A895YCF2_9ACTN|nr:potassium/proton antiporter [Natronosporangium hydrolyticum]QSB13009.1 potassium/proton antiporter [Natronosporangium hydrolyticum]